jgi:serine/threonine-protein kinase
VRTAYAESQATFSPDSRWIAYSSDESGRQEVMIGAFPGTGSRRQVSTTGGETPAFSSDGRTLFYRVKDELWAVPITTDPVLTVGPASVVFKLSGVRGFSGLPNYVMSRTGNRVLAVKSQGEDARVREVQVVVNWFDAVQRTSAPLRESPEPPK